MRQKCGAWLEQRGIPPWLLLSWMYFVLLAVACTVSWSRVRWAHNPCAMSYSFPVFTPVSVLLEGNRSSDVLHTRIPEDDDVLAPVRTYLPPSLLARKYSLHRFSQGYGAKAIFGHPNRSHPLLFVPGHGGSHKQIRSIAGALAEAGKALDTEYGAGLRAAGAGAGAGAATTAAGGTAGPVPPVSVEVFTCDFDEEPGALIPHALRHQAAFVAQAVRAIRHGYVQRAVEDARAAGQQLTAAETEALAPQVTLVAHSMGGVVARAAALLTAEHAVASGSSAAVGSSPSRSGSSSGGIGSIVALATPYTTPPSSFDGSMASYYGAIDAAWQQGSSIGRSTSSRNSSSRSSSISGSAVLDVAVLSISGGGSDTQMWEGSAATGTWVPAAVAGTSSSQYRAQPRCDPAEDPASPPWAWVATPSLPAVAFSVDHIAILWCGQLVGAVVDATSRLAQACAGGGPGRPAANCTAHDRLEVLLHALLQQPHRASVTGTEAVGASSGTCSTGAHSDSDSMLLLSSSSSDHSDSDSGSCAPSTAPWWEWLHVRAASRMLLGLDPHMHSISPIGMLAVAPLRFGPTAMAMAAVGMLLVMAHLLLSQLQGTSTSSSSSSGSSGSSGVVRVIDAGARSRVRSSYLSALNPSTHARMLLLPLRTLLILLGCPTQWLRTACTAVCTVTVGSIAAVTYSTALIQSQHNSSSVPVGAPLLPLLLCYPIALALMSSSWPIGLLLAVIVRCCVLTVTTALQLVGSVWRVAVVKLGRAVAVATAAVAAAAAATSVALQYQSALLAAASYIHNAVVVTASGVLVGNAVTIALARAWALCVVVMASFVLSLLLGLRAVAYSPVTPIVTRRRVGSVPVVTAAGGSSSGAAGIISAPSSSSSGAAGGSGESGASSATSATSASGAAASASGASTGSAGLSRVRSHTHIGLLPADLAAVESSSTTTPVAARAASPAPPAPLPRSQSRSLLAPPATTTPGTPRRRAATLAHGAVDAVSRANMAAAGPAAPSAPFPRSSYGYGGGWLPALVRGGIRRAAAAGITGPPAPSGIVCVAVLVLAGPNWIGPIALAVECLPQLPWPWQPLQQVGLTAQEVMGLAAELSMTAQPRLAPALAFPLLLTAYRVLRRWAGISASASTSASSASSSSSLSSAVAESSLVRAVRLASGFTDALVDTPSPTSPKTGSPLANQRGGAASPLTATALASAPAPAPAAAHNECPHCLHESGGKGAVYVATPPAMWKAVPGASSTHGPWTGPTFRVDSCDCWLAATVALLRKECGNATAPMGSAVQGVSPAAAAAARTRVLQQHISTLTALRKQSVPEANREAAVGAALTALSALSSVTAAQLRPLLCGFCACKCARCSGHPLASSWLTVPDHSADADADATGGHGASSARVCSRIIGAGLEALRSTVTRACYAVASCSSSSSNSGTPIPPARAVRLAVCVTALCCCLLAVWLASMPSADTLARLQAARQLQDDTSRPAATAWLSAVTWLLPRVTAPLAFDMPHLQAVIPALAVVLLASRVTATLAST